MYRIERVIIQQVGGNYCGISSFFSFRYFDSVMILAIALHVNLSQFNAILWMFQQFNTNLKACLESFKNFCIYQHCLTFLYYFAKDIICFSSSKVYMHLFIHTETFLNVRKTKLNLRV